jgi:uncharacterized membrane protein YfcA
MATEAPGEQGPWLQARVPDVTYALICTVALVVSTLTLFSGFGLGTLLMPAFALFFPVPMAVAATAVVHLANNAFKVLLVGRRADLGVVARFALPAAVAAMAGAAVLALFADVAPLATHTLGGQRHEVTLVKLTVAVLMLGFALLELLPRFHTLAFDRRYLALGGVLSGFFGGLSGHQGALRSAFLVSAGLERDAFVGTSVVSAVVVDVARLLVYGVGFRAAHSVRLAPGLGSLVGAATLAAFVGSFLAARLLPTVTMRSIRLTVAVMLAAVALGLATGLV